VCRENPSSAAASFVASGFCCHILREILGRAVSSLSQNHRIMCWKRPLRSLSSTTHPTPPFLLNHILKCHIYTFFKPLQGWELSHLPGQPVPVPDHSFSKEIFPNNQSKPPLKQLEAIASRPIISYLGEETNTCLTTTSFQEDFSVLSAPTAEVCS